METIRLNFINRSTDSGNSHVVIFQKNTAGKPGESPIAWQVFENAVPGESHAFNFDLAYQLSAGDEYGNYLPQLTPEQDALYEVTDQPGIFQINRQDPKAPCPGMIGVENSLESGIMNVICYRSGKLLCICAPAAQGQTVSLYLNHTIWIAASGTVLEEEAFVTADLVEQARMISLSGVQSANIVLTGGNDEPLLFSMESVVMD